MKKLMMIVIALLTLNATAQNKPKGKEFLKGLSAEDIATLKTKKMTLHLDLTESQQIKIKTLVLEEAKYKEKKRAEFEAKKKSDKNPTKEERFAMMNERLDREIEMKKQMKNILNDEQYKKWNSFMSKKNKQKRKRRHNNKPNERH